MTNTTDTTDTTNLVTAASKAGEQAAEAALAGEDSNRLDPAVAESLVTAGFARHFVPERWGGSAAAPGAIGHLGEALAAVGAGCMSAAWCAGVLAALGRMCAHLPPEGQYDLWGDGPDVPLAGSLVPSGTVRAVDGGWRLTGQWSFASGVDHARWTTVGGVAPGTDGPPVLRHFLLPRSDYRVLDTWRNVGLRATGSNTVVVDDVFVPAHRTFDHRTLLAGDPDPAAARPHRIPLKLLNGLYFLCPGIGAVEGALQTWTQWTARRTEANRTRTSDRPGVRLALAGAAGHLDAAKALVGRVVEEAESATVTTELPLRATRDYTVAADLLLGAVNSLLRMSGSRGQSLDNPVQRVWRDVHCMAGHGALQPDVNADGWARYALGEA
ncbi:acyl-CoA dehydrogenase family protein [Streptomyces cylindrosporus]|uniref:Acyl-CoA dehydrogenase C-terminal domain-containing protein n=1 Tax=Streptomyces cylindrosporus TaxID=2927583 RepID=A0ABS9YDK9_9ACTN|nr:acyl-CoA dehydrogenase family protein [Streptomyces cylindrosporus]MCI3275039.1 hypothetical protein [Streptomyces cylindrosporus]